MVSPSRQTLHNVTFLKALSFQEGFFIENLARLQEIQERLSVARGICDVL
jgi:hypothetical protein